MNNTYTNTEETCPGCFGTGIQMNKDGLRVLCPICGGKKTLRPWWQPIYESVSISTNPDIIYQVWQ